jgi:anti-sigma factor RsiW
MKPLEHQEAQELADALHDGELDAETAERVNAHILSCERCQKLEVALGGTLKNALTKAPDSKRSPDLLAGVQRRIRLRSRGRYFAQQVQTQRPNWPVLVTSAITLILLAVAYYYLTQVLVVRPDPQLPLLPEPSARP